jgi:hypothetical protein
MLQGKGSGFSFSQNNASIPKVQPKQNWSAWLQNATGDLNSQFLGCAGI